jgi:hypothetical protein
MKNTFWFRHFLMCHVLANKMIAHRGWVVENFAQTILDELENRVFGNSQMNVYFWQADEFFCDLHCSDSGQLFDFLEEEDVSIEDLAKLTKHEIDNFYDKYCIGKIKF